MPLYGSVPNNEFQLHTEVAMHELNHKSRECLGWKTSCQVFHDDTRRLRFTQPERMAIYEWIRKTTESIILEVGNVTKQSAAAARRKAIEAWLVHNNIIKVTRNGESVTQF